MMDHTSSFKHGTILTVSPLDQRLLAFAKKLHGIEDFDAMLRAVSDEIRETIGYNNAWIAVFDVANRKVRILAVEGPHQADIWQHAPVFPIDGDPYIARILHAVEPQIVTDAQLDPDVNREVVERLGNRSIVNVPMRLVDQPFGALGTGSFGDEGVRLPSEEQLAHLVGVAGQLVTAAARLVLARERAEAARHKADIERRLLQRQKLESLGELAGGVAHDFNNLLTVITASTSLLLEGERDAARRAEMRNVIDAATRAAELTRRLLALGKRQPLRMAQASLSSLVDSVVGMIRRVIPASIEIRTAAGAELPVVTIDAGQVEQVLMNLCLNARDAMPDGGRLSIGLEDVTLNGDFARDHPWARPGRYVRISVTDTGVGMSAQVLERAFEPFFTTKTSGGTGLGLAVSRGIVEQHGGMLHGYSEPGVGTTFKAYLPAGAGAAAVVGAEPLGPLPRGDERILIADDDEQVRCVVARVLERAGYTVVAVADGASAVERVRAGAFDLAILDAVMPVMGGRQAFEAIRAVSPDIPILFASGYGAEELTARFLADIDAPLLPKPFDPDTLLRAVRRLLDARQAI